MNMAGRVAWVRFVLSSGDRPIFPKETSTYFLDPRIYLIADPSHFGGDFHLGAAALPSCCAAGICYQ
jgi:hypothetical protein